MILSWYGLSSFKISSVGDKVTIITDPFSSKESGLTAPRGGADIVLISKDTELHNNIEGITGDPLVIRNPGEFDIKGVHIRGIVNDGGRDETTIYHLEVDGVRIAFLGALNLPELTQQQLEDLNGVDVAVVPIGGKDRVCNWEAAAHIVQQIEPKYVVPSYFSQKGLKFDLDESAKFLKELGGEAREEERLTLKSKDLSLETIQVISLLPQR